jgi:hypothetical protein
MHADSELSPWPRMQEETTRDITGQPTPIQERWAAVWERSRAGRHTVVVGPYALPMVPPDLQESSHRLVQAGAMLPAARLLND